MSADIELKLALSPQQLARLRAHSLVRGHSRAGSHRERLTKTYFDTPQLLLRDNAVALGVERAGRRKLQTLATTAGAEPLAQARIDGDQPDVRRILDPRWRKLLNHTKRDGGLTPVFTTEYERSSLPLQIDGSQINLALDVGHIRANGREQPICEARLALVAGEPEQLYRLALELHDSVPFHIQHRDTIMRGYSLVADEQPAVARARPSAIAPQATIGAAFQALARDGFAHMCGNEDAVLRSGNPEAVHQMRVAVRRLRALLSAFHAALDHDECTFMRGELGWLQRQLGPARDWDVFVHGTLAPLSEGLSQEASLGDLRRAVEHSRHQAYGVAREALRDRRYTRFLLRFQLWLDATLWEGSTPSQPLGTPVSDFAVRILEKRYRKLRKLGDRFPSLSEEEMHEVRLRTKKLRYAAEFFHPLHAAKASSRFIKVLTRIQDTLGSLHDAVVGRDLLKLLTSPDSPDGATRSAALERAIGVAAGFQAARIAGDIRRFGEVWPRFVKLKKFWRAG